ncbi:MAG: DUF424 family protein [Candidatus Hodarchaeales archaeon]
MTNENVQKTKMRVSFKVHRRDNKTIYAFADPDMLGNTYSDGTITMRIRRKFYEGKLIDIEDALALLKRHHDSNIVGNLVRLAVKRGLIHRDSVLRFKDKRTGKLIYHVMLMRV